MVCFSRQIRLNSAHRQFGLEWEKLSIPVLFFKFKFRLLLVEKSHNWYSFNTDIQTAKAYHTLVQANHANYHNHYKFALKQLATFIHSDNKILSKWSNTNGRTVTALLLHKNCLASAVGNKPSITLSVEMFRTRWEDALHRHSDPKDNSSLHLHESISLIWLLFQLMQIIQSDSIPHNTHYNRKWASILATLIPSCLVAFRNN